MDILSVQQVAGIVMVFMGGGVLSFCSNMERREQEKWKDPRVRYGRRKSDVLPPSTVKGTVLTVMGMLIALGGMLLILMDIKL